LPTRRVDRNQLTPEQCQKLETWLFDGSLGCAETVERARREFGLQATTPSVGPFRRRCAAERQADDLAEAQAAANDLNDIPADVASLRAAMVWVGFPKPAVEDQAPSEQPPTDRSGTDSNSLKFA
jgi:hypothetical protein